MKTESEVANMMGFLIGLILFIGMMALFNGINHLSRDVRQLGLANAQTSKSILVSFLGLALLVLAFFMAWLQHHVR